METKTGFVALGCSIALAAAAIALAFVYRRRRGFQPIRSRFWWQPLLTTGCIIVFTTYLAIFNEFVDLSCELYLLSFGLAFNVPLSVVIRAVHIYSAYEVSKVVAKQSWQGAKNLKDYDRFFVKYAEKIQSIKYQAVVFCTLAVVHLAAFGSYAFTTNPVCDGSEFIVFGGIGVCYILTVILVVYNIRALKDGLYIKRELIFVAIGGFITVPTFMVLRLTGNFEAANLLLAYAPYIIVIVQLGFPLYISYLWSTNNKKFNEELSTAELSSLKHSDTETRGSIDAKLFEGTNGKGPLKHRGFKLSDLLADTEGRKAFTEFCRLELNHESVLYYVACKQFLRNHKKREELGLSEGFEEEALELYRTYIERGCELELNIGADTRDLFRQAGFASENPLDPNAVVKAFRRALSDVYTLLLRDPYGRFLASPIYQAFVDKKIEAGRLTLTQPNKYL